MMIVGFEAKAICAMRFLPLSQQMMAGSSCKRMRYSFWRNSGVLLFLGMLGAEAPSHAGSVRLQGEVGDLPRRLFVFWRVLDIMSESTTAGAILDLNVDEGKRVWFPAKGMIA